MQVGYGLSKEGSTMGFDFSCSLIPIGVGCTVYILVNNSGIRVTHFVV